MTDTQQVQDSVRASHAVVDYTTCAPGLTADGRIESCPACGETGLVVRYTEHGGHHPAHYIHRRPAYSAEHPRIQQQQARDASRQSDADSCYVDPAPRADSLRHNEAADIVAWVALVRRQLTLLESSVALGWYGSRPGENVWNQQQALVPLMAPNIPAIQEIVSRAAGAEAGDGR